MMDPARLALVGAMADAKRRRRQAVSALARMLAGGVPWRGASLVSIRAEVARAQSELDIVRAVERELDECDGLERVAEGIVNEHDHRLVDLDDRALTELDAALGVDVTVEDVLGYLREGRIVHVMQRYAVVVPVAIECDRRVLVRRRRA